MGWKRARDGYTVCDGCIDKLADRLEDVADRYARLNPRPGSNSDHGGRGAPGFGSRSPASDHIIVMQDWRSKSHEVARDGFRYVWDPNADHGRRLPEGVHGPEEPPGAYTKKEDVWIGADDREHAEQESPARSVPFTLAGMAGLVAEERDMTPPCTRFVGELVRWLDVQLDFIARQEWVVDFAEDLRALQKQLRPVTGDPPIRIGLCPNTIDEGEHSRECGAPLFAPTESAKNDTIRCSACNRKWPRSEWESLGKLMQDRREERDCA